MLKKVLALVIVVFFLAGSFNATAAEKNVLQGMYDWFWGWDKGGAAKTAECCCKACGVQCCKSCNSDCGGKCCTKCVKK